MFDDYVKKVGEAIFNDIQEFKQSGESSFDKQDTLETYEHIRNNLGLYISGLLEGIVLERGFANNLHDISDGFRKSYNSKVAVDPKPKKENFRTIDLVERNFDILFANNLMGYISAREYIDRWQIYNQLFAAQGDEK